MNNVAHSQAYNPAVARYEGLVASLQSLRRAVAHLGRLVASLLR